MFIRETLDKLYPKRILMPEVVKDIPRHALLVYILVFNDKAIVLGHGKSTRARVIFDDKDRITQGHIKAIFVRACQLYGCGAYERYVIKCTSKKDAAEIEKKLHKEIGGNRRELPADVHRALFSSLEKGGVPDMVLRMALSSSFDGLADIRRWRREGLLDDSVWKSVSDRLRMRTEEHTNKTQNKSD